MKTYIWLLSIEKDWEKALIESKELKNEKKDNFEFKV